MRCPALLAILGLVNSSANAETYLVYMKGSSTVPTNMEARIQAVGGTVLHHLDILNRVGIIAVNLSADAANQLRANADIEGVDLDNPTTLKVDTPQKDSGGVGGPSRNIRRQLSPDDPTTAAVYASRQWNMRAIQADKAWAAGKLGSPSVRVAVLDSGIDYTHVDLAGRVDLAASKSFLPDEDARVEAAFPGAHPIADLGFQGTHVSSLIASNAYSAAGVTSKTTLVGVKVCSGAAPQLCPQSAVMV